MAEWGSGYGVAVIQDIMVCECIKLLVMYCLTPMNARPQLQVIRRVINDAALTFVQQGAGDDNDVRVVQHFSPACRAAHLGGVNTLAAAAILRSLTDADLERCRAFQNFTVSMILLGFIIFFAVVALLGEAFFDQLADVINTVCWNGFVMANSVFYTSTPSGLIILYIVTGCCVLYYFGVFTPSIEKIRDLYAQYSREHGASHAHVSGPSQLIAGRLPPTSVLLHKRSNAELKREGRVQTWHQEWHRFRHVTWMRLMAEYQTWNLVIVGEHWAIERRRLREFGEIWSRMNKGTAVQGMTGTVGEGHADDEEEERSTTPDSKQRIAKSKILIRPKSSGVIKSMLQQIGPVELPDFILNMRSSGLKIKLNTVEGLLEEKKLAAKLFGANNSPKKYSKKSDEHSESAFLDPTDPSAPDSLLPVVYANKAPADLPSNPELDITTDPKRALRRMLLMLKAQSNPGRTGASNLLVVRRQTDNSGQEVASAAEAAFNALHIGGHNGENNNEQQRHQRQKRDRHHRNRHHRSSFHATHDNQLASTISVVDSGEVQSGNVQVLMCELSVLLSWIWESFWPGGSPLSKAEQAEVQERFDDWRKAMQATRKPTDGRDDDMWDPDHDYGTTFSVFAGWFLVLVSYLCKLREIEDVNEDELDDLIDEMMDDESVDEVTKQQVAKRLALRERFLRRRVQGYDTSTTSDNVQHIAQEEKYSTEDMDYDRGEETKIADKKMRIRERFLKRRVQGYAPIKDVDDDISALEPAVREALKDAYFGQAPPIPYDFIAGESSQEAEVKEMLIQRTLINRERFLRRRVQVFMG